MLMATKTPDYFHVDPKHQAIDRRLENWAQWVAVRRPSWVAPMFKMARSNARQWHAPEVRTECNTLDAAEIEKAVYALPEPHRAAIRWCYVYKYGAERFRKLHGVWVKEKGAKEPQLRPMGDDTLLLLIRDGRQMLINRI